MWPILPLIGIYSLVCDIKDLFLTPETAICHLEYGLVERLRLVKVVSVQRAHLVSMQVFLSFPSGAIPFLPIAAVA